MMEIKPGTSAINMPGEEPKKSKLESALQYMSLASSAASLAKNASSLRAKNPSMATRFGQGAGWKPNQYTTPLQGATKRILGDY
jgi:hypothetical protein